MNRVYGCPVAVHQALAATADTWGAGTVLLAHLNGAEWEFEEEGELVQVRCCGVCGSTISRVIRGREERAA